MRPEFSANPLGTDQDNRLSVGPSRPRAAGLGWSVCTLMDVKLIVQVEDCVGEPESAGFNSIVGGDK